MNREALAKQAVREAALIRARHGIRPAEGLCPYDLAIKLGIKVSLLDAASLEGMYSPAPEPTSIILSSERPAGRRRYTCGHELGHHVFNHGYMIDELDEENSSPDSPEEYLAQRFSSALLMPKIAVDSAFSRRGWPTRTLRPEQVYKVAHELGVGYTSLIANMQVNLRSLAPGLATSLSRVPLAEIRQGLAGFEIKTDVYIVDQHWLRPTVDVEVGDLIVLPQGGTINGQTVSPGAASNTFTARASGVGEINLGTGTRALELRVSKRGFTGLARYRHFEDVTDE